MRLGRLTLLAVIGVAIAAPGSAPAAVAGGATLSGSTILYEADPGEANDLTVSFDGAGVVFDDPGATITPQLGCTAIDAHRVTCTMPSGELVGVDLADGDDRAKVVGGAGQQVYVDGEQGNDELTGSEAGGGLGGGPGSDVLTGGSGTGFLDGVNSWTNGSQEKPPTVFPDHDTLTCVESEGPDHPQGTDVNIDDLDAVGGPCGQRTFYAKDGFVEVRGSDRPDLLSASYYPTRIYGLGGDDRLFGGTCSRCRTDGGDGNDTLEGGGLMLGGPGNDHFSSAIANSLPVRQDGGPGDDVLVGRYGPDRLVGGPGRDRISGGDGNDYVDALDREADSVNCGAGRDTVLADKADKVKGCERVLRSRPKSRATAARAAAASSSSGKCRRSSTTGHANVIARSSKAVVFAKRGYYYACLYSGGPIARLLDEGGGITEKGNAGPKFAGGFLAYATEGSAIGDEFDRVVVWDLRTGTVLYEASSTYVDKIALKSDGAAAWTAASVVGVPDQTSPRSTEVHLFSPGDDLGDLLVDRGSDIDRLSLAPGPGGSTITWTAGGQTRSADWH